MKRLKMLLFTSLCGMIVLAACSQQESPGVDSTSRVEPALVEVTEPAAVEQANPAAVEDATPGEPEEMETPGAVMATAVATADRDLRLTPGPLPPGIERVPAVTSEPVIEPVPDEILASLLSDLQQRSGINIASAEDYSISRSEAVVWPDGSLGCPQPGVVYTQAPVAGYWIVIDAGGKSWDYRATQSGTVILCERGLKP